MTIDTFEDTELVAPFVGPDSGVDDPVTGVLDGRREYDVNNAQGTMDINEILGRLRFTTTGASILTLTYPNLDIDLDFLGPNDAFELDVSSVSNAATFSISVFVQDNGVGPGSDTEPFVFTSPGTLRLEFSQFTGVDFTDVDNIELILAASGPGFIKMTDFRVVPEPASAALLGLGLLGLAISGRRRSVTA